MSTFQSMQPWLRVPDLDRSIPMALRIRSHRAAVSGPQATEWKQAMEEELQAIYDHEVFGDGEFVDLPEGRRALPSHWVYKVKRDGTGNIQRFKARLVCRGNQQEGIDYQEAYAPTARLSHVRLALAIAAKYGLEVQQMDVCTAFLGVPLEEEIYGSPAGLCRDRRRCVRGQLATQADWGWPAIPCHA